MHLVTKRWVAEALTAMASAPGVGYWLTAECLDPVASVPLLRIFLLLDNASSGYGIPWPPDQRRVKLSVRRALDDLGVLKPEFALNEHRN